MGQHATMHVKSTEDFNGQDGKWLPARGNAAGQLSIALLAGELQQFNRLAGGAIYNYTAVGADTIVSPTPALFGGIVCLTNGTSPVMYDNTSATGQVILPGIAMTAGQVITLPAAIITEIGLFADWTTGTYLILHG